MNGPQDDDRLPDEIALMEGKAEGVSPADFEAPGAEGAQAAEAPAEGAAAPAEGAAPAQAPEAAAAPAAEEGQFIPQFKGELPADYNEAKKALRDSKSALLKQWSEGELTDDDYNAKVAEVDDKLEAMVAQKAAADALDQANRQMLAQQQQTVIEGIRTAGKTAGVDYGTPDAPTKAAGQFDVAMRALLSDPDMQAKSFAEVAAEAHRTVLALNGKLGAAPAAPAPSAPPAKAAATKPAIPPTLGAMPNAAPPNAGQDASEQFDAITDPDEREARWAAMPQRQREQMLRGTVSH